MASNHSSRGLPIQVAVQGQRPPHARGRQKGTGSAPGLGGWARRVSAREPPGDGHPLRGSRPISGEGSPGGQVRGASDSENNVSSPATVQSRVLSTQAAGVRGRAVAGERPFPPPQPSTLVNGQIRLLAAARPLSPPSHSASQLLSAGRRGVDAAGPSGKSKPWEERRDTWRPSSPTSPLAEKTRRRQCPDQVSGHAPARGTGSAGRVDTSLAWSSGYVNPRWMRPAPRTWRHAGGDCQTPAPSRAWGQACHPRK